MAASVIMRAPTADEFPTRRRIILTTGPAAVLSISRLNWESWIAPGEAALMMATEEDTFLASALTKNCPRSFDKNIRSLVFSASFPGASSTARMGTSLPMGKYAHAATSDKVNVIRIGCG